MPAFSVVVPSLGKIEFLQPLFESVLAQTFAGDIEILLCLTGEAKNWALPDLKPNISLKVCASSTPGISQARNIGIAAASGEIVFFLDEDCYLPSPNYLQTIFDFCKTHPGCGGGGAYLTNDEDSNFASAFYNYLCNSWLESHVDERGRTRVLLGGCCFYPRECLKDVRFPEHRPRAGEEADFNNDLLKRGCRLMFNPAWSVCHEPHYNLEDVFQRAWKHGLELDTGTVVPPLRRLGSFLNRSRKRPENFFKFLPLTLAYSAWGRAAFASKRLRK